MRHKGNDNIGLAQRFVEWCRARHMRIDGENLAGRSPAQGVGNNQ
jgi:hypothetical protein